MSKVADQLGGSCLYCTDGRLQHIPTIQYFEDVFPQMQNVDFDGESATDAIYNDEWAPQRYTMARPALSTISTSAASTAAPTARCSGRNSSRR